MSMSFHAVTAAPTYADGEPDIWPVAPPPRPTTNDGMPASTCQIIGIGGTPNLAARLGGRPARSGVGRLL